MENTVDIIRTSVRNLVEFIFRSGDIDSRRTGAKEKQAMEAGSRMHRKIQRQMGSTYESEVSLKLGIDRETFRIQIEGRADGIFHEKMKDWLEKVDHAQDMEQPPSHAEAVFGNGQRDLPDELYIVDEIKGIYRDLRKMKEPVPVHKAQALCYAYIYALQNEKQAMGIQMTYCHLENETIKRFYDTYTFDELKMWFGELMQEYERWAKLESDMRFHMRQSLQGMEFPFPYRKGQRKLAVSVYRSIEQRGELFIQAPTGIGKTMSVLFPALKAMGEGMADRLFYLTAKTITRTVAQEAFEILKNRGLEMHSVTITAKERMCPMEECNCNPEACPRAKGHFDRVNDAVYEMVTTLDRIGREDILKCAETFQVCPFELNLDLTSWSQGIICDYNYVFDPNVYLRRFFGDNVQQKYLFLIDEAHNLPDRARTMYSADLVKEQVLLASRNMKTAADFELMDTAEAIRAAEKTGRGLKVLNKKMLSLKKETRQVQILTEAEILDLYENTVHVQNCISSFLEETKNAVDEELLNFYFELRHFNAMCEIIDENYLFYCSVEEGTFHVHLLCANPAVNVHRCIEKAVSSVFFSATMLPMHYYKELLTTQENAYAIYVDSPFDNRKRLLAVAEDVSSRYTMRNEMQYRRIFNYILQTVSCKKGNYMVFFPSYQYMMEIAALYDEMASAEGNEEHGKTMPFRLLVQQAGMKEEGRDAFLKAFAEENTDEKSLVGFCVIGGIFAEGIDLTGEKLIGVLVVGTGLGQISTEGELLKQYFESHGKPGYDYAYRFPGINKVFQAAGRVIRTTEDEGVIILLDNRMLLENHVRLFPMDWENYQPVNQYTIKDTVETYWEERRGCRGTAP